MSAIIPGMATRPTWLGRVKGALPPLRPLSRWLAAFWVLGGLMACGLGRPTPVPSEASLPPTPAPGVIEVLTTPEGASVSVNGLPRGDTPQRIAVSPGVYAVSMAKGGFESVTAEVTAEASRKVMITRALRDIAAPWVQMAPLPAEVTPDQGLKVSAQAGDNVGVSRMVLRVGDRVVCEAEEPTLRTNVDTRTLAVGQHAVIVQAWDEAGNLGIAENPQPVAVDALRPTVEVREVRPIGGSAQRGPARYRFW